jgi:hypothetical protein
MTFLLATLFFSQFSVCSAQQPGATQPAQSNLGDLSSNPAHTCWEIKKTRQNVDSQFYWIQPDALKPAFQAWCLMTKSNYEEENGGWTLMANNYIGGGQKPFINLDWEHATGSLPFYQNLTTARDDRYKDDPESFLVYMGLKLWSEIATYFPPTSDEQFAGRREILYIWSMSTNKVLDPDHAAACRFRIDENDNYKLIIKSASDRPTTKNLDCAILHGDSMPEMFTKHNGAKFSTLDRDNSQRPDVNCAAAYQAPFWYWNGTCWDGSIFGVPSNWTLNGAYWTGMDPIGIPSDQKAQGRGPGVGLVFVR